MDYILRGLNFECALVYMDDIIVFSSSFEEHLHHLSLVFARMRKFNCQLRLNKCRFGFRTLEYLGHVISTNGVHTKPAIVTAISDFPCPASQPTQQAQKAAVKSFVTLTNFYRRFIKGFAQLTNPLISLTKKDTTFNWTPIHEHAFTQLKQRLSSAPILAFPQWDKPFYVTTDASNIGVGAVLEQYDSNSSHLQPVQFMSYTFQDAETRWSMPEKELFAFIFALRKLRVYLYGRSFTWRTDAASLKTIQSNKKLSPKLLRWTLLISDFRFKVKYINTPKNAVADTLSRYPVHTISTISTIPSFPASCSTISETFHNLPFTKSRFTEQQRKDPYCRIWISKFISNDVLPLLSSTEQQNFIECKEHFSATELRLSQRFILLDQLLRYITDIHAYRRSLPFERTHLLRPVVPYTLRQILLKHFHESTHRRGTRTARDISTHFYWPYLYTDANLFVASCHSCNSRNAKCYLRGILHSSPAISATHRMSIDIIGPRPITVSGYRYILVMVNHYTKWVVAVPLKDRNAKEIMDAFESNWLTEGYTCQQTFADRAPELWTNDFKTLLSRYGSTFIPGPPHHSQTQGHVERANRTIQDAIAKNLDGSEHNWIRFLKPIIQAYRLTVHEATGFTPFFMTHGWEPLPPSLQTLLPQHIPADLSTYVNSLKSNLQHAWDTAYHRLKKYHDRTSKTLNRNRKEFAVPIGSFVYVRIPPRKGQSQAFQSFNSGLWKLLSYDKKSNNCTVTTRAGPGTRTENVHSQYIFPFEGSLSFLPKLDYLTKTKSTTKQSSQGQPSLMPRPHQLVPRRRGRPPKHRNITT